MTVPDSVDNRLRIGIINFCPVDLVPEVLMAYLPGLVDGSVAPFAGSKLVNDGVGNLKRFVALP